MRLEYCSRWPLRANISCVGGQFGRAHVAERYTHPHQLPERRGDGHCALPPAPRASRGFPDRKHARTFNALLTADAADAKPSGFVIPQGQ